MEQTKPKYNDLVQMPWWLTEVLFWSGFGLTSFIALSLFYGEPSIMHVFDLSFEAVMGVLLTRPLLWAAPRLERLRQGPRLLALGLSVVVLSQLWNVIRMLSFPYFFPGAYVWDQYGGWAFSATLIFALWTMLFYVVRTYNLAAAQRDLANRERFRRLNAEKLSSNAQLKMLRYQINPHFIFNTLSSVNALIATGRNADARAMVDGLSDMLRLTLERDPPLIVPLSEEVETIRRYLDVEKMRFGDRLVTRFDIDDALKDTSVPSLILQPIVENAVRHGVEAQSEPCEISVVASRADDRLELSISDTGPGLTDTPKPRKRESLGLENVQSRLESVYGDTAAFSVTERPSRGVQVVLSIPLSVDRVFQ